jgi:hypothetical protein
MDKMDFVASFRFHWHFIPLVKEHISALNGELSLVSVKFINYTLILLTYYQFFDFFSFIFNPKAYQIFSLLTEPLNPIHIETNFFTNGMVARCLYF